MEGRRINLEFSLSKTIKTEQCPADFWFYNFGYWITYIPPFGKLVVRDLGREIEYKFIGKEFDVEKYFKEFFLPIPYEKIENEFFEDKYILSLLKNKNLALMFDLSKEYRILEVVLTQNTNIKRIKEMQRLLFINYGERLSVNGETYYSFPKIEKIARESEENLKRKVKCGYRAKYLIEIARKIVSKEIDVRKIGRMKTEDAREYLMRFKGIGLKTADLILMYAFGRTDTFPVDVRVKREIERVYLGNKTSSEKIHGFAIEYFGKYSAFINLLIFSKDKKSFWNVCVWK